MIKALAGKKIHGITAVPGGVHKTFGRDDRDRFINGNGLTIGQVGTLSGINTSNGDVTVQTESGSLTLAAPVSAGDPVTGSATVDLVAAIDLILSDAIAARTVVLRAGDAITQSQGASVSATNLGLSAVTAPALNLGANVDIAVLAADITGPGNPFTFTDSSDLSIGQVGLLSGITTRKGNVTVQTGSGALTLEQPIDTNAVSTNETLILLVANGGFANLVGENGLQPGDGRFGIG